MLRFWICVPTAPLEFDLLSPNNTLSPTVLPTVTLSWASTTSGQTCGSTGWPLYKISLSTNNPPDVLKTINTTSVKLLNMQQGTWYWSITAFNLYHTTTTSIWSFQVSQISFII